METDNPLNNSSQVPELAWLKEQTIFRVELLDRLAQAYLCDQVLLEPQASSKIEAVP